jgi:hypothetical protein
MNEEMKEMKSRLETKGMKRSVRRERNWRRKDGSDI